NFEQPFWSENIEEASDGRVTAQVTTFDQMGMASGDVFRQLQHGVFDIGSTVADYVVSDAPALAGLDMPTIAPDVATAEQVVDAFEPVLADIMQERFDAHLLAAVPYPPQVVFCNTEISGLSDLEGKKVRAAGGSETSFLEAIGAQSITMEFSEVPGGLQRGVIDCAVSGSLSGYSSGWYEVADYLYSLPIGGWDYVITAMNGDAWNALDDDFQTWLQNEITENYADEVWTAAVEQTTQGINCLTGQGECELGDPGDMTLVEPTEEDIERAHEVLVDQVLPEWADGVDSKRVERWNDTIGEQVGLQAEGWRMLRQAGCGGTSRPAVPVGRHAEASGRCQCPAAGLGAKGLPVAGKRGRHSAVCHRRDDHDQYRDAQSVRFFAAAVNG